MRQNSNPESGKKGPYSLTQVAYNRYKEKGVDPPDKGKKRKLPTQNKRGELM